MWHMPRVSAGRDALVASSQEVEGSVTRCPHTSYTGRRDLHGLTARPLCDSLP